MNWKTVAKFLIANRSYALYLLIAGFAVMFWNNRLAMIRYQEEADRWRRNYTVLDQRFSADMGAQHAKVQQMEFTINELLRQSTVQMLELRYQLRLAGVRIQDLEHALTFQQEISDTLYIQQIDTVLVNCLEKPVRLEFKDSLSVINVQLNPDLSAQADYSVKASVYGFIHRQVVPRKEKSTGVGQFLSNTLIKYGATKWMVKKKVIYNTDIKSNNPNLQLYNVQSLRIIDN